MLQFLHAVSGRLVENYHSTSYNWLHQLANGVKTIYIYIGLWMCLLHRIIVHQTRRRVFRSPPADIRKRKIPPMSGVTRRDFMAETSRANEACTHISTVSPKAHHWEGAFLD